jgi:2-dehydro-3-deoxyphosphogluconate aldolase / (4S)-4-hydroxy-2-oxoglutarate aldolase
VTSSFNDVIAALSSDKVAAVVRAQSVDDPGKLARTLADEGIRCVEFTFTIPGAAEVIASAAREPGAIVGAGTVRSAEQAATAIEAGARFIVSPGVIPDVARVAQDRGIPVILGALTATEVHSVDALGATAVKIFPAGLGGPRYLRDLRGPFPGLAFMPSGGVTPDNVAEFLAAGATAVFAGSDLVPPAAVASGDYAAVSSRARRFRVSIQKIVAKA